jgi:hypothetical protein
VTFTVDTIKGDGAYPVILSREVQEPLKFLSAIEVDI